MKRTDVAAKDASELSAVAARYARRDPTDDRYSFLRPEVAFMVQERQRAVLTLLARQARRDPAWADLAALRLVEVGCGGGGNLLELLRFGFVPAHLTGIELLPERVAAARSVLPAGLPLIEGDACSAPVGPQSQDVVLASTVFSSLLDAGFQQRLAQTMWSWLRPGGAVLWYDFTYDNPRNPDVRGVRLARLRELFPAGCVQAQRITLAPPLARCVVRLHPGLYTVLNALPLLRTHLLAWVAKPSGAAPARPAV